MSKPVFTCPGCSKPLYWIEGTACTPCMDKAGERLAAAERARVERMLAEEAARAIERELRRQQALIDKETPRCTVCTYRFETTYRGNRAPICPNCYHGKPIRASPSYEKDEDEDEWTESGPKHATCKGGKRHGKRRQR